MLVVMCYVCVHGFYLNYKVYYVIHFSFFVGEVVESCGIMHATSSSQHNFYFTNEYTGFQGSKV